VNPPTQPIAAAIAAYRRLAWWLAGTSLVVCVAALGLYLFAFGTLSLSTTPGDWGVFGDYVGGVLGAVSGVFALAALLVTVVLQARNLEYTKQELGETRAEMARQRFQTNFFSLVSLLREARDAYQASGSRSSIASQIAETLQSAKPADQVLRAVAAVTDSGNIELTAFFSLYRHCLELVEFAGITKDEAEQYRRVLSVVIGPEDAFVMRAMIGCQLLEPGFARLLVKHGLPPLHWSHRELISRSAPWWGMEGAGSLFRASAADENPETL
jgi:uncharacterized membrane protein